MAENYTLVESDISTVGMYAEVFATKGTPVTGVAYKPLKGIFKKIVMGIDDGRTEHNQDGMGPVESVQTQGLRMVEGSFQYLPAQDFDSNDAVQLALIAYAMGKNSLHAATGRVLTRGQQYITFDTGSAAIAVGDVLQNNDATATARVTEVLITANAGWGGTTSGVLLVTQIVGEDWPIGENLKVGAAQKAVITVALTEIRSELDAFTLWVKEKGDVNRHHVLKGVHIQKVTMSGDEQGEIVMDVTFKAMDYQDTEVGTGATLPPAPQTIGMPPWRWNKADGTVTLTRLGTSTRLDRWEFSIDNKNLKYMNKDAQRTAAEFVPLGLLITGNLQIRLSNDTIYTLWTTDPNSTKSIPYDNRAGAGFTVGERVVDTTTGAHATIIADGGTPLTVKDIVGIFNDDDEIKDDTGETADVNGVITDAGTADFTIVLSKNAAKEYMSMQFFNTVPTGKFNWESTPSNDDTKSIPYTFKVLRSGNLKIDLLGTA